MKAELELMKSKLDNPESNRDMQNDVSKNIEIDLETEDSDINRSFNDKEVSNEIDKGKQRSKKSWQINCWK